MLKKTDALNERLSSYTARHIKAINTRIKIANIELRSLKSMQDKLRKDLKNAEETG